MSLATFLKQSLSSVVPVTYCVPFDASGQQRLMTSFGLQRSGQHLVIDWICRGIKDVVHLNHCRFTRKGITKVLTPLTGRRVIYRDGGKDDSGVQGRDKLKTSLPAELPETLFYSVESVSLKSGSFKNLLKKFRPLTIVIVRDPANWLASSLAHGQAKATLSKNIQVLKEYLQFSLDAISENEPDCLSIDYTKFIASENYRNRLASRLGVTEVEEAEKALTSTPDFGGGSSFGKTETTTTLCRWMKYQDNPFFRSALADAHLIELAHQFFENPPGLPRPGGAKRFT